MEHAAFLVSECIKIFRKTKIILHSAPSYLVILISFGSIDFEIHSINLLNPTVKFLVASCFIPGAFHIPFRCYSYLHVLCFSLPSYDNNFVISKLMFCWLLIHWLLKCMKLRMSLIFSSSISAITSKHSGEVKSARASLSSSENDISGKLSSSQFSSSSSSSDK